MERGDDGDDEKIIGNKVGVVELAEQPGSVSQALGFSRESFYRFLDVPEKGGEAARIEMSRRGANPNNRIAETIEQGIVELAVEQPAIPGWRASWPRRASGSRPPACGGCGVAMISPPPWRKGGRR